MQRAELKALLVDPSLFTAPYDAALSAGLAAQGVAVTWARRALRAGEDEDLPLGEDDLLFYRWSDGPRRRTRGVLARAGKLIKGGEHLAGLRRLEQCAKRHDVVHFQWTPLPRLDAPAMRRIAAGRPVVLTVHDTEPFNGAGVSGLQRHGFDTVFDAAHHLIVHTERARETLVARGVDAGRIAVIPHGPLALRCTPRPAAAKCAGRWRVVLFGRLQTYKGIDVLIEALGRLASDVRERLEVVVAGEPFMPLEPLAARARELGLVAPTFQMWSGRLNDQAMADLLGSADAFVFPYRAIEASGVLFLVAGLRKWIIASDLGAFSDTLGMGGANQGALVVPGDIDALAGALAESIGRVPDALGAAWAPDWSTIGAATRAVYEALLDWWPDAAA